MFSDTDYVSIYSMPIMLNIFELAAYSCVIIVKIERNFDAILENWSMDRKLLYL